MKKRVLAIILVTLVGILIFSSCSPPSPPRMMGESGGPYPPSTQRPPTTVPPAPTFTVTVPPPTVGPSGPYPPSTQRPPTTMTVPAPTVGQSGAYSPSGSGNIGLAAGGAKDVNNFRVNIRNNYLPLPTDVTYEGLFYDYFFDTGMRKETNKLYAPSYSYAVTKDPLSHQTEYYLSVGLNSGMKEADFQRKKLNLVIVLDNSGSMGAQYNQYYYDRFGVWQDAYADAGITRLSKMDSAKEAVVSILNQLTVDDRLAIVLFNSSASLLKPMGPVNNTDMRVIKNKVLDVYAGGSTDVSAGVDMATDQFRDLLEVNSYEYENRIILLTDAQPNTGDLSSSGLAGMMRRNADSRIYFTAIGVGVDFNSQLIDEITKTRGANYYSMHSPREFKQRVEEEFEFMVTPLVFNLQLNFESSGWRIEKVFGSPEADQATGQLMKINTLFPSKTEGGETKGGLVLLKLRRMSFFPDARIFLRTSYEDRNGRIDGSEEVFTFTRGFPEYFENTGIRKGILLSRYAALLKNWMIDERQHIQYSHPWDPAVREDTGIVIPPESNLSQWERQSLPLTVSAPYKRVFRDFSQYFHDEMQAIKDFTLDQELEILNTLAR